MAFRILSLLAAACLGTAAPALATVIISQTYETVATVPLKQTFGTTRDWRAEAMEPRIRREEPAQLCFMVEGGDQACTSIISQAENGAPFLNYTKIKKLAVVAAAPQVKALVLEALFPQDLNMSIQTSLWTYSRETDSFGPVLTFALTEVGRYRILADGPLAGHVLTAEFVPGKNENRYDAHRFRITAYRWMGARFEQVLSYVTPERFDGETEESADEVQENIFAHEMPRIRALLKQVYPEMKARIPPP